MQFVSINYTIGMQELAMWKRWLSVQTFHFSQCIYIVFVEIIINEKFFKDATDAKEMLLFEAYVNGVLYGALSVSFVTRETPENRAIHVRVGRGHFCICLKF